MLFPTSVLPAFALVASAALATPDVAPTAPPLALEPCTIADVAARCGTLTVFENRATREGRTIDLNIVVLLARGHDRRPDPIFFLHGGPGAAATDAAPLFARSPLGEHRDFVLVDQRGTGRSNPLGCATSSLRAMFDSIATFDLPGIESCRASYDADLRQYTTTIAMADLDDVRSALGYDTVNLFGGSYGTKAALEYIRRYPGRVRTAYLRGVHPPSAVLPANFDRDSQAALDAVLSDCENDRTCGKRHPDLAAKIARTVERLDEHPESVTLVHPQTRRKETVVVDDLIFRGLIHYTLYSSAMAARLPAVLDEAAGGSVRGVLENVVQFAVSTESRLSLGMFLSVVCTEDAPFLDLDAVERDAGGTLLGGMMSRGVHRSCSDWPRGELPDDFKRPVRSDVPALLVSGAVDPVTAPHLAAAAAAHLPNSLHVVVEGTSHGTWTPGCVDDLLARLVETGSVEGLDAACVADVERPRFRD